MSEVGYAFWINGYYDQTLLKLFLLLWISFSDKFDAIEGPATNSRSRRLNVRQPGASECRRPMADGYQEECAARENSARFFDPSKSFK